MKTTLFACILFIVSLTAFAETAYKCTLKGRIYNRTSKVIYLLKASVGDARTANKQLITIKDSSFFFTFDVAQTEAYQLIFEDEYDNGSWFSVVFFPQNGEVNFNLYPLEIADKSDKVEGGTLNQQYYKYWNAYTGIYSDRFKALDDKRSVLEKNHNYYSPARDSIIHIINTVAHQNIPRSVYIRWDELRKSGDEFTAAGKKIRAGVDSVIADRVRWTFNYINSNIDLVSYYLILKNALFADGNKLMMEEINTAYPKFASKYPDHPYTAIVGSEISGWKNVKVGRPLLDFNAPDINGVNHSLSDLAKGKIALVDFWGSWCGPCISNTRTMVPIYNEFKDKGFTIVGIAREYKSIKELVTRLKIEKYEWLNLVELDDKNGIWNKYGISNGTGLMVLLDKDGKIIAIDPTAEQVKKAILAGI